MKLINTIGKNHRSIQCNHSKRETSSFPSLPWNKESSLPPFPVPQEVCEVSISGDNKNLPGQGHEQSYQALKSTLIPKVPLTFNYSVVFCVYGWYCYYWTWV